MPLLIFVGIVGPGIAAAKADPDVDSHAVSYGVANADLICTALDQNPTVAGVADEMEHVYKTSDLDSYQTGQAVTVAVRVACPEHMRLLLRFANTANPKGNVV